MKWEKNTNMTRIYELPGLLKSEADETIDIASLSVCRLKLDTC